MLNVLPYLFLCFIFHLSLISEAVSPVRLEFYETVIVYKVSCVTLYIRQVMDYYFKLIRIIYMTSCDLG